MDEMPESKCKMSTAREISLKHTPHDVQKTKHNETKTKNQKRKI